MDPLRHRLVVEATRLFVERGFDGTSMREIADACGVTKAALYYHYPSKADLLLDIVDTYLEAVSQAVARGRDGRTTAAEQLRGVIAELFALPPEGRAVIRVAMHDLRHLHESDRAAFGAAYHQRFLRPLTEVVQAGNASGEFGPHDPATVVWIILGMLYPFLSGGRSQEGDARAIADLSGVLLDGLRSRPAG